MDGVLLLFYDRLSSLGMDRNSGVLEYLKNNLKKKPNQSPLNPQIKYTYPNPKSWKVRGRGRLEWGQ